MKKFLTLFVLFVLYGVINAQTAQISGNSSICVGQSAQLRIDFTNGPVDIVYTDGTDSVSLTNLAQSPYYLEVSPIFTTVYTLVSVTDSSCSEIVSGAGVVTVKQLPLGNITSVSPVQCYGQADGSATFVPSQGCMPFTYYWDDGVTTAQNNQLLAGLHSVTVTDANGCSNTFSTTILQPDRLQLFPISTNVNCYGNNNGIATVSVTGGVSPYSYQWDNGQSSQIANGLSAGTYAVTVTDANACQAVAPVNVGTDPMLTATITSHTNVLCAGSNTGSATVTATGGTSPYSYSWSNGQNSQTASGLVAGTYMVTVTDMNGCTAVATPVTITQPPQLVATLTVDDVNCMGTPLGSAIVSVNGGVSPYSYNWSTGVMTSFITNLAQGGYSVTVTDANNCMVSGSPFYFTVGQDPVPVADAIITSGSSSCGGSDVDLLASGGDSYLWSTGAITPEITVNPLVPTWYYVTVTNEFGCSDVDSVFVPVNPMPVISFDLQEDICSDGNPINLASLATVTPYNGGQVWFTGVGVASNIFYPSTVAVGGTYDIKAHYTDPVTGCYNSVTKLIIVHHPPTTTLNIPQGSLCLNDAPLVLTGGVPGGGVYSGNGVNNGVFNPALAGAGTHQIFYTYTDPYGCVAVASDNIVVSAPTNVRLSTPATEMCTGDAPINLTAYPSGGYYMVDGISAPSFFDPSYWGAGIHIVTYTLISATCGGSDMVTITVYETPLVSLDCPVSVEENSAPVLLVVSPPGGELTINGQLSGVYFDPAYWGPGVHNIIYTYTNGICEASVSRQITVNSNVGIFGHSLIDIQIFPNPVSDILNIELGDVRVSEIQIFDIIGKIIYSERVNSDKISVDMSELIPTMYYVRFVMQDGQVSKPVKVLKQ